MAANLDDIREELHKLRELVRLGPKLGLSTAEAARITGIGICEIRKRCGAPEGSPFRIPCLRIGRKIVIPRSSLERLMAEQAQ